MKKPFLYAPFVLVLVIVAVGVIFVSSKKYSPIVGEACQSNDMTGLFDFSNQLATYDGAEVMVPLFVREIATAQPNTLGVATTTERWIEVDLSGQKLRAWEGNSLYLETLISSGLPWTPTPPGEYHIWAKLRYARMEGGMGRYYYNLPNVPFVMYFENDSVPGWKGYGLHGTYWHHDFGRTRSHGCVNLPTTVAEKLFYWVTPIPPEGKSSVYASSDNPGTRIVIHE
jgi:lipoprotein-anchoring transpeptidase ErfK/SrfK